MLELRRDELYWLCDFQRQNETPEYYAHYHHQWLKKRSGSWRLIEAPKPLLKTVQRTILSEVFNQIEPHRLACGFAPNKSVLDHLRPHVNRPVQMKMDLKNFFTHITTGRVYGLLRMAGYSRDISHRIALLTTVATPARMLDRFRMSNFRKLTTSEYRLLKKRHLPQGAPTSPAIANLCAFRLDLRLSGLARSLGGVHYTRYADDLQFSGYRSFRSQAARLAPIVGAIAIEEGFELNFHKTKIMTDNQRQQACGVVINSKLKTQNSKLNIQRREYDRLKATLFNCIKHGLDSQNRENHPRFHQQLLGKISWVESLNPTRGAKLRSLYHQIEIEK